MIRAWIGISALALVCMPLEGAPKRSRSEAVPGMQASNTAGLGDIGIEAAFTGQFRITPVAEERLVSLTDSIYGEDVIALYGGGPRMSRDLLLAPTLKATLGLAGFLQLEVENVPWDGEKIGASRAGLTLTTPGNDDLRVLGLAVMADAILSTEEDIYSRGETTPGFDPLFHVGIAADADFIKWLPALPLKVYVNWRNLSNYRLAHAFKQQWGGLALEWKGYRRSYYGRLGMQWFKALPTRLDPDPNRRWRGPHADLGVGTRWFFGDRFWGKAEISFDPLKPLAFYSDATHNPPKVFFGMEMPLVFQETRAEALRSLLFNEEMRKKARRRAAVDSSAMARSSAIDTGRGDAPLADIRLDHLELKSQAADSASADLKILFEDQEDVSAQKRKKVRQELQHIEDLLP